MEKVLGLYLPKDDAIRKNEQWEVIPLAPELLHYAALDVFASRLIFERATNIAPFDQVTDTTWHHGCPPNTGWRKSCCLWSHFKDSACITWRSSSLGAHQKLTGC